MTRFLQDTAIAGLYLDRKRGVYARAESELAKGNRIGIAGPVLAELVLPPFSIRAKNWVPSTGVTQASACLASVARDSRNITPALA